MSTEVATPSKTVSQPIDFALRQRSMDIALKASLCWAVMFGVGESYFSIFATYIHAPRFYFGLLAGIPQLLGPISQLFGADAVDRTGKRKRLTQISVCIQSLCYAPLAVLPFLGEGIQTNALLLGIVMIYFIGAHFCNPAWNSWISVLVPSEERGTYFARNARGREILSLITKLALSGVLFFAGKQAKTEMGELTAVIFACAFTAAGFARFGSFLYVRNMHEPPYEHTADAKFTFWQFIGRIRESNFVRFVLFVSTINFGAFIAAPFFIHYSINTLKFETWQWIMLESCGAIASITTVMFWGSFSHRFGNKRTLRYTSILISLIPLMWLISVNFYFLMAVNLISGLGWAGFNLCAVNYIFEAVSPPKRARCVAYFNLLVGIGCFCGSMLGGVLYAKLPTTLTLGTWTVTVSSSFIYLLILSTSCRLGMSLFSVGAFKELRQVESFELRDLLEYVTEISLPTGSRISTYNAEPEAPAEKKEAEEISK